MGLRDRSWSCDHLDARKGAGIFLAIYIQHCFLRLYMSMPSRLRPPRDFWKLVPSTGSRSGIRLTQWDCFGNLFLCYLCVTGGLERSSTLRERGGPRWFAALCNQKCEGADVFPNYINILSWQVVLMKSAPLKHIKPHQFVTDPTNNFFVSIQSMADKPSFSDLCIMHYRYECHVPWVFCNTIIILSMD